jgi:predicted chitinase
MNVDTLCRAMPGLPVSKAQEYLALMEVAMHEFQITSELRSAMWLAQVGHESASLVYFEELASGAAYEGRVDLGNTHPGDGVRYKGRGPIQITGRTNYAQAGAALGIDLIANPTEAAAPNVTFRLSAWWWRANGLNEIADTGSVDAATLRINGGYNGLADRQYRYTIARGLGNSVLPDAAPARPAAPAKFPYPQGQYLGVPDGTASFHNGAMPAGQHAVSEWQQQMVNRGFYLVVDGHYGPASEQACKSFQQQHGIEATGKVDAYTWAATWA